MRWATRVVSTSSHRWVSLFEVVTVGLPFCAFKLLTGLALVTGQPQTGQPQFVERLGTGLLLLGGCDLLLNAINLLSLLVRAERKVPICAFDAIAQRTGARPQDLGIALDVFVSFVIVAVVIGAGLLKRFSAEELLAWNVSVILNVLGAGVSRLLSSLRARA